MNIVPATPSGVKSKFALKEFRCIQAYEIVFKLDAYPGTHAIRVYPHVFGNTVACEIVTGLKNIPQADLDMIKRLAFETLRAEVSR